MKMINIELLKKGDVVLTTSSQKRTSGVIRAVTKSDISHAMICVSHGSVIDSTSDGVQARNIQKMFYDDSCEIYILRPKDSLSEDIINRIVSYARTSTGTRYSLRDAVASIKPPPNKVGGQRQFCSRMVARAYAFGGVKLVDNPDYCTPEDIKKSNLLMRIEPSALSVSQEMITAIEEVGDTTEGMRNVTNSLLGKLRALDDTVESVSDINNLIVQNPNLDEAVSKALEESGYLDFWKVEIDRFPWRYDKILLVQFYHALEDPKSLLDYCKGVLSEDRSGDFDHWHSNASAYSGLANHYNYKVFRLFAELYFKLSFYHSQRVKAAEMLLKLYGDTI